MFDTKNNCLKVLKVYNLSIPKPRRRSSLSFIGNCMIMFGGFNSDYYNDLFYVNVAQNQPKPKKLKHENKESIIKLLKNPSLSNSRIQSIEGK